MSNNIKGLSDARLIALLGTMQNGLDSNLVAYGLTAAEFATLETDSGNFNTSVLNSDNADAAKLAATQDKKSKKTKVTNTASNIAKKIYANVNVTDQMLANIGLAPRNSGSTRTTPKVPLSLVATTNNVGEVRFQWKRNGNSNSTIFVIQQLQAGVWTSIYSTGRTRETLTGFAPVETRFRVFAQVNGLSSPPSPEVIIWGSGDESTIELAA